MKVTSIRVNTSLQADLYETDLITVERFRSFTWIQLFTSGWTVGARNRTKNFSSFGHVYAYLNKLLDGGWLSEDDYYTSWLLVLALETKNEVKD